MTSVNIHGYSLLFVCLQASRAQILNKATDYINHMRRKNHSHQVWFKPSSKIIIWLKPFTVSRPAKSHNLIMRLTIWCFLTIKSPNITIFGKISAKTTSDSKHPWKKEICYYFVRLEYLTLEATEAIKKKTAYFISLALRL
jgi:hypothetical protein